MDEDFLVADATTLPFGWVPTRRFASATLADAWSKLQRCCGDDPEKESEGPCLSKTMILATIGLWSRGLFAAPRTTPTCAALCASPGSAWTAAF